MDDTVKARSFLSFHLNFMLLMINSGREEDANRSLQLLAQGLQELPEDLYITEPKENN